MLPDPRWLSRQRGFLHPARARCPENGWKVSKVADFWENLFTAKNKQEYNIIYVWQLKARSWNRGRLREQK